jgi:CRP-like cAMP-binding protein
MTPDLHQSLRTHEFLKGFTESQLYELTGLATEVTFEPLDEILAEGQRSSAFYLLISGSVAVELRTSLYGICVEALGPGQVFGWSSLLAHHDTLFEVRAREHTVALCLDGDALRSLLRRDPVLGVEFLQRTLRVVAGRVKATELRFAEMCGIRV